MNWDEYNILFHKLNLNRVAFKEVKDCSEEILMLVNAALAAERKWVGLTDEEIHNTKGYEETREMYDFARHIEAKLKEKNS
jgi:hypothetical protein